MSQEESAPWRANVVAEVLLGTPNGKIGGAERVSRIVAASLEGKQRVEDVFDTSERGPQLGLVATLGALLHAAQFVLALIALWEKGNEMQKRGEFRKAAKSVGKLFPKLRKKEELVDRTYDLLDERARSSQVPPEQ